MEKFLNISGVPDLGSQLVGLQGIKGITSTDAGTTVVIAYNDGTATTITTAAQDAVEVYETVRAAVVNALATSWQKPGYDLTLPKAVVSIVNA